MMDTVVSLVSFMQGHNASFKWSVLWGVLHFLPTDQVPVTQITRYDVLYLSIFSGSKPCM